MMRTSIKRLYSAVMRCLSASGMSAGRLRTGPQNRLSSALRAMIASSCGSTFCISTFGCTTPACMPARILLIAWSNNSGMPTARRDQLS